VATQPGHCFGIVIRNDSFAKKAAYLASAALYRDRRLDGKWQSCKRAGAGNAGFRAKLFRIEFDDSVQQRIETLDLSYMFVRQFKRRYLALLKQFELGDCRQESYIHCGWSTDGENEGEDCM
jgi:hypothetical protein